MLNVRLTSDRPPVSEIAVYLAVAVDVFDGILCCAVSPPPLPLTRGVLDEIWD